MNKKKGVYTKPVPQDQSLIKYYYNGFSSNQVVSIQLNLSLNARCAAKQSVGSIIRIIEGKSQQNSEQPVQQVSITLVDNGTVYSIGYDFQMVTETQTIKKYTLKSNLKKTTLDLFTIKLCDHFPQQEAFLKIKNQLSLNNSENLIIQLQPQKPKNKKKRIRSPPLTCKYCQKVLEYFYFEQQKEILIKEVYNQLQIDQIQQIKQIDWEVVLNEHFTKNTSIAKFQDKDIKLDQCGKITFLVDWQQIQQKKLPNNFAILKYRKIYCKHQKVQNDMCQVCLQMVDPIQLNLKKYLFQMQMDDSHKRQMIMSGDALLQQENLFVQKLYANNKAILILDLDNTVLHSVQLNKINANRLEQFDDYYQIPMLSNIRHAKIFSSFVVKMRPYFKQFLEWICEYFQIYVYTKGTRSYAQAICNCIREQYAGELNGTVNLNNKIKKHDFLKNKNCFTLNRIITRDEDNDLYTKSLDNILPNRQDCLMILDDLKQVWKHSLSCLHTVPFYYFWKIDPKSQIEKNIKIEKGQLQTLQKQVDQFQKKQILKDQPLMELPCDQFQQEIVETQKQIIQKQESGKLQFVQEVVDFINKKHIQFDIKPIKDYFLLFAADALIQIHKNFFAFKNQQRKVHEEYSMAKVHKFYRAGFFKGQVVKFCMDYQERVDVYGRADKLGLKICKNQQEQTPNYIIRLNNINKNLERVYFKEEELAHRASLYQKRDELTKNIIKKLKYYNQTLKIRIVSQSWISMSYLFTYPFPVEPFIIPQQKIFQNMQQQDFNFVLQQKKEQIRQMRQKTHQNKNKQKQVNQASSENRSE